MPPLARSLAALVVGIVAAISARSADSPALKIPDPAPAVVLKLDDLATGGGNVPQRWRRLADFAKERKLKISIGVICQSLETAKPAYFDFIKDLQASGLCEFWFHGYDHKMWEENGAKLQEFKGTPYEQQKDHFVRSQALAREKLGFAFTAFGSPFNGFDDSTLKVFSEDADMQVFLYGNPADQGKIPGKIILDRVGDVNIENPLFLPSSEKFIAGYLRRAPGRRCFVAQGHPNQWDDARWAEFVKIVDFLQQNRIPVITPTEAAQLSRAQP